MTFLVSEHLHWSTKDAVCVEIRQKFETENAIRAVVVVFFAPEIVACLWNNCNIPKRDPSVCHWKAEQLSSSVFDQQVFVIKLLQSRTGECRTFVKQVLEHCTSNMRTLDWSVEQKLCWSFHALMSSCDMGDSLCHRPIFTSFMSWLLFPKPAKSVTRMKQTPADNECTRVDSFLAGNVCWSRRRCLTICIVRLFGNLCALVYNAPAQAAPFHWKWVLQRYPVKCFRHTDQTFPARKEFTLVTELESCSHLSLNLFDGGSSSSVGRISVCYGVQIGCWQWWPLCSVMQLDWHVPLSLQTPLVAKTVLCGAHAPACHHKVQELPKFCRIVCTESCNGHTQAHTLSQWLVWKHLTWACRSGFGWTCLIDVFLWDVHSFDWEVAVVLKTIYLKQWKNRVLMSWLLRIGLLPSARSETHTTQQSDVACARKMEEKPENPHIWTNVLLHACVNC